MELLIKVKVGDETLSFQKSRKVQVLQQFKKAKNASSPFEDKEFDLKSKPTDPIANYGNDTVI